MNKEIKPTQLAVTNSLIKRFRKSIFWLYVITIMISIPIIYFATHHQVYSAANRELSLLVDLVASLREHISKDVRPGLLKANLLDSPSISSVVTTSMLADHFRNKRPEYHIKVASDNPLNPKNLPEPLETELLNKFRADKDLKEITEIGLIQGQKFLVSARPSKVNQECMLCHSDPKQAPLPVTVKYGVTSGYNYKLDSVVGTIGVGVHLVNVNTLVIQRGLTAIGIITVIFTIIFVIINSLVKNQILLPIAKITEAAVAISKGNLEEEVDIKRDGSEIGELAHSFELLRRSLKWTMEEAK